MLEKVYSAFLESSGICTDTRKITSNSVFVALKGPNFNANDFALQALEKGAKLAIVDEQRPNFEGRKNIIQVDSALTFLQKLANYHRHKLKAKIIALTGSNGKTTTKELLQLALSTRYNTWCTPGNFNNHIGLPLTLLQATTDHEFVILEMGDNAVGDIRELCAIAEPDYGFITNIGKDHIGGFGSFENNVKAKLELFDFLLAAESSFFYLSSDNALKKLIGNYHKLISLKVIDYELSQSGLVEMKQENGELLKTALIGDYNALNLSYAKGIATHFNCDQKTVDFALANYEPKNNRSQQLETETNTILLDAYNANPSSVELVLAQFDKLKALKPKAVILGDMLELGEFAKEEHENVVRQLESMNLLQVFLVGSEFKRAAQNTPFHCFETTEKLREYLKKEPLSNHHVLLKGSRKFKLESLVDDL